MSNATAKAPARATEHKNSPTAGPAADTKSALAAKAAAPEKRQSAGSQFSDLANVLHAASRTDELDEYSGNATRLLCIAEQHAEEAASRPQLTQGDTERFAFDLAALVSAARRVPSDNKPTVVRTELIAQAGKMLDRLTGVDHCLDADNARSAAQVATATDITDGYTRAQLLEVLEHIAGRASNLSRLLMCIQDKTPVEWTVAVMVDAAQAMAHDIGATADRTSGGSICGDIDYWAFGPNFAALGKAGAA